MEKIVIALDGHAGCGKSTTAKLVADKLGYIYVDTGAMYRAVTLYFLENSIDYKSSEAVARALEMLEVSFIYNTRSRQNETLLNGKNVEADIRTMRVTAQVSEVSAISAVRRFLVKQQQQMGLKKGLVMDGRDIGTVVFPDAELKVYMTASIEARAERRKIQLDKKGEQVDIQAIMNDLAHRDNIDSNRQDSPLAKASDAFEIDTSHIALHEQVEIILGLAENVVLSAL